MWQLFIVYTHTYLYTYTMYTQLATRGDCLRDSFISYIHTYKHTHVLTFDTHLYIICFIHMTQLYMICIYMTYLGYDMYIYTHTCTNVYIHIMYIHIFERDTYIHLASIGTWRQYDGAAPGDCLRGSSRY